MWYDYPGVKPARVQMFGYVFFFLFLSIPFLLAALWFN